MYRDVENMYPRNGRTVKENGQAINLADFAQETRESDVTQMSRDGTLFRGWFQGTLPSSATWYFALVPPPGIIVFGVSRIVTIESGEVTAQFWSGGTLGAPTADVTILRNFKISGGTPPVSTFKRYASYTGGQVHSPESLITAPTTGPQRIPSIQTEEGAQVRLDSNNIGVFRISNQKAADTVLTLYLTWQELPA